MKIIHILLINDIRIVLTIVYYKLHRMRPRTFPHRRSEPRCEESLYPIGVLGTKDEDPLNIVIMLIILSASHLGPH